MGTTFADLLGRLPVVRVECSKCGRFGRYPLHRLIDQHGGNGTVIAWLDALTADCPRKRSASICCRRHARWKFAGRLQPRGGSDRATVLPRGEGLRL